MSSMKMRSAWRTFYDFTGTRPRRQVYSSRNWRSICANRIINNQGPESDLCYVAPWITKVVCQYQHERGHCLQIRKRILVFSGRMGKESHMSFFVGNSHTETLEYVQSEIPRELNLTDIIDAPLANRKPYYTLLIIRLLWMGLCSMHIDSNREKRDEGIVNAETSWIDVESHQRRDLLSECCVRKVPSTIQSAFLYI